MSVPHQEHQESRLTAPSPGVTILKHIPIERVGLAVACSAGPMRVIEFTDEYHLGSMKSLRERGCQLLSSRQGRSIPGQVFAHSLPNTDSYS